MRACQALLCAHAGTPARCCLLLSAELGLRLASRAGETHSAPCRAAGRTGPIAGAAAPQAAQLPAVLTPAEGPGVLEGISTVVFDCDGVVGCSAHLPVLLLQAVLLISIHMHGRPLRRDALLTATWRPPSAQLWRGNQIIPNAPEVSTAAPELPLRRHRPK